MDWWFSGWMPRSMCGPWNDALAIFYGFGHFATFAAYMAISAFMYFRGKGLREQYRMLQVDISFALFIMLCGFGHLLDFGSLWWVSYPLHTVLIMMIAIASWAAFFHLPALVFALSPHTKAMGIVSYLEKVLASSTQGVYLIDTKGNTVWCNASVRKITGWDPKALVGKHQHTMLHYLRPGQEPGSWEPYPEEDCSIYKAFINNETQEMAADWMFGPDGTPVPVSISSHPVADGDDIIGALVVFSRRDAGDE